MIYIDGRPGTPAVVLPDDLGADLAMFLGREACSAAVGGETDEAFDALAELARSRGVALFEEARP